MKARRFLSVLDFDHAEIQSIFELTQKIKEEPLRYKTLLNGKALGLIFEKPSTRTWVSFEVGFSTLGGNVIYLGPQDIKLGVREEVRDVARVLARYLDAVVIRTFSHRTIVEFSKYFNKTVINGLSDLEHPCQIMADLFTIREIFGDKKVKIAYVGDGNNVLHSLMLLSARLGVDMAYATPQNCEPKGFVLKQARLEAKKSKAKLTSSHSAVQVVRGAVVVI